jgi:hypothetical protein
MVLNGGTELGTTRRKVYWALSNAGLFLLHAHLIIEACLWLVYWSGSSGSSLFEMLSHCSNADTAVHEDLCDADSAALGLIAGTQSSTHDADATIATILTQNDGTACGYITTHKICTG